MKKLDLYNKQTLFHKEFNKKKLMYNLKKNTDSNFPVVRMLTFSKKLIVCAI